MFRIQQGSSLDVSKISRGVLDPRCFAASLWLFRGFSELETTNQMGRKYESETFGAGVRSKRSQVGVAVKFSSPHSISESQEIIYMAILRSKSLS